MTPKVAGATVSLALVALAVAAAIIGLGYGVIDDGRIAGGFLPVATATVVVVTGLLDARGRLRDKSVEVGSPKVPWTFSGGLRKRAIDSWS